MEKNACIKSHNVYKRGVHAICKEAHVHNKDQGLAIWRHKGRSLHSMKFSLGADVPHWQGDEFFITINTPAVKANVNSKGPQAQAVVLQRAGPTCAQSYGRATDFMSPWSYAQSYGRGKICEAPRSYD